MEELAKSLEKLDLQGILVLQGILTQQALKIVLNAEQVSNAYKPPKLTKEQSKLILPNNSFTEAKTVIHQ